MKPRHLLALALGYQAGGRVAGGYVGRVRANFLGAAALIALGLAGPVVDALFAQIGRVKISNMYEDEIRSLGDHCVVPLTQFLCENGRQDTDEQRRTAARILADVAQPWSAGELIKLLPDRDGEVRYHAARALQRVAGFDFGRSPEQYRDEPAEAGASEVRRWQDWWAKNQDKYPRLPTS